MIKNERRFVMNTYQVSQLLGIKVNNKNKREATEFSINVLSKVINLFRTKRFGIITLHKINSSNLKSNHNFINQINDYLKSKKLNYIQIMVQWYIKFVDVMNFKEVGYLILEPSFEQMTELTKMFDQNIFVYSENSNTSLFYPNGEKIDLQPDKTDLGSIVNNALILNCIDFKLFIDSILDFHFQFVNKNQIQIDDKLVIFSKNHETYNSSLDLIIVHDIRQNGIISFERYRYLNTISPKVYHFDEIVWAVRVNSNVENKYNSNSYYKKAI